MANPDYSEFGPEVELTEGSGISAATGWIGAACSVALIAGLGWWSYDLLQRDVNGLPVIARLEGQARIQPEQSGGFQAANQGLAVNEISSRGDQPPTEQFVLAPAPVALADEDQPQPALEPQAQGQGIRDAVASALEEIDISEPVPDTAALTPVTPYQHNLGNVPRPKPRPDFGVVSRLVSASAPLTQTGVEELDPSEIPAGTRLVQIGAWGSPEIARTQWERTADRFGPYLAGKARVIEPTQVGDKVLYRLRVHGFGGLPDARRFCAALEAENVDCIPVVAR